MAMLCASVYSYAYDFEVNGFYYEVDLDNMTATLVAGENKQSGEISIPASVAYKGREFSVTSINGAFSDNNELTKVTIPKSIESLGARAFEGCSSLQWISGLNNITELGVACFAGCASLTAIDLPEGLKKIGSQAFKGCVGLYSISIPNTVNSIGSEAFQDCSSLSDIQLPPMIANLSKGLFQGCSSLDNLEIPHSIVTIEDNVFAGCKGISSIIIPANLQQIGNGVFDGCIGLTQISIEAASSPLSVGYNKTSSDARTPLFEDCPLSNVIMGRDIESSSRDRNYNSIGCFSSNISLTEVAIGENVSSIEEGAFRNCSNLKSISIPQSVVSIGEWAFASSGLEKVTFEDGYDNLLFSLCLGSWDYKTPHTFANCKIESAYIGRTLSISGGAQNPGYGRNPSTFFPTTLRNLTIGDYVKNIDVILMNNQKATSSLSHYSKLEAVQFGTNLTKLPSLIDNSLLTHLSISSATPPEANPFTNSQYMDLIVEIPEGSLNAYKSTPVWSKFWTLKESANLLHCIEFGGLLYRILSENEVEVMKKNSDYSGNIIIPSSIEYNNTIYKVTSIGEAFKGCSDLISVSVPPTVLSLDNYCFADCNKLEHVDLNSNLESIPFAAFQNCYKLSNIQIPQTVTRISGCAFKGCSALDGFTCPKSLSSIGESAFEDCVAITSFSFSNISSVGQSAFKGCNQLKNVELNNNISVIPAECFSGCVNLENLNNLQLIIRIENNAFENCKSIKAFELQSIISIANYAFKDCNAANSVILGDGLQTLGDGIFYNCSNIESLIIPGNVENIGRSVFSGCSALKVLTFNDGETTLHLPIGSYDGATSVQKKEVNGEIIQFKIQYYKSAFDGLPIEKLYLGRNLSDSPRYTITGDGGVDYYLITSYDSPFNNLPKLRELTIGENVDVLGPNERFITEVEMYVTPGSFKKCSSLEKVNVKNTIPPTGAEFSNTAYSKATLIVPDNTESLYEVAEGWKEFMNIVAETSAGIDEINANKRNEYISVIGEGIIYIGDSVENVYVYGIDGRLILSTVVSPNQSIALSNGLYIIKIKNKSFKVMI